MAKNGQTSSLASQAIEEVSQRVLPFLDTASRMSKLLAQAKKSVSDGSVGVIAIEKLVSNLKKLPSTLQGVDVEKLILYLSEAQTSVEKQLRTHFPNQVKVACDEAGVPFRLRGEVYLVGPFEVAVDYAKEVAQFSYAHVNVGGRLTLHPQLVADCGLRFCHEILMSEVDLEQFRLDLAESMRVVEARQDKQLNRRETRAEIPSVYTEWVTIQERRSSKKAGDDLLACSLPRFIVELKQFAQSSLNLDSEQPFQLEPAVIENAKNPKKSVFLPRDPACGFGEGTYYQAIVHRSR